MRFEQIIPLYDDQPIAKRFATQDTRFEVTEGNIHAIISETELVELLNSGKTMYSGMNDIKIDITGLRASISSLATAVDANTGNITSLDSRVATYSATLDGVSADLESTKSNLTQTNSQVAQLQLSQDTFSTQLSNVTTNLSSNYYTKTQVDDKADEAESNAISAAASDASTKASNAQANAISAAARDATTKANQALASANSATDLKLQNYSTTEAVTSAINQKADAITLEVSETYSTKAEAQGYASTAQTNAISAAASDATTKANNAISTAAADATTKANNAISTAATDATAKANNAIAVAAEDATTKANDAIATAAADATTKANNAKASADASTDLKLQSYSTTTQMNSAIAQSANNITSTVSETYATKVEARNYVDNTLESYSTTTQMNSAIAQSASGITSTVSQTYATKTEAQSMADDAENDAKIYADGKVTNAVSQITQTTDAISLSVSTNTANISANTDSISGHTQSISTINSTLSSMDSRIDVYDNSIVASVAANGLISSINQSSETIKINASKVNITGDTMISAINGATGTVKINASKINLSGYVTVSALSTAGSTTINGSNITTGSISADRISGGSLRLGTGGAGYMDIYKDNDRMGRFSAYNIYLGGIEQLGTDNKFHTPRLKISTSGSIEFPCYTLNSNYNSSSTVSTMTLDTDGIYCLNSQNEVLLLNPSPSTRAAWEDADETPDGVSTFDTLDFYPKTSLWTQARSSDGSTSCVTPNGFYCDYGIGSKRQAQYTNNGISLGLYHSVDGVTPPTVGNRLDGVPDLYAWFLAKTSSRAVTVWSNSFNIHGSLSITGSLSVSGTKPRLVETKDYGERFLYCYETPTPFFGDIGDAVIGEDGLCYISIDSIFAETVTLDQYQVFVQPYGEGQCFVKERKGAYFVIEGDPNLEFGWEIKARQADFDQLRLTKKEAEIPPADEIDYIAEAVQHINEINKEREYHEDSDFDNNV